VAGGYHRVGEMISASCLCLVATQAGRSLFPLHQNLKILCTDQFFFGGIEEDEWRRYG
jgi:hypothetical protein